MKGVQFHFTDTGDVPVPNAGSLMVFLNEQGQLVCKDEQGVVKAFVRSPVMPSYMWHINTELFEAVSPVDYGNNSHVEWLANLCVEGKQFIKAYNLKEFFINNGTVNGELIEQLTDNATTYITISKARTFTQGVVEYSISTLSIAEGNLDNIYPHNWLNRFHKLFVSPNNVYEVSDLTTAVYNVGGISKKVGVVLNRETPNYEI